MTILGSGTSHGVPVIGCSCPVCQSPDEHDRRGRSALLVSGASGECIAVDSGPEFRLQAIRAGLARLDALLVTHAHADHLHGLDDVRPLTAKNPLAVYSSEETLEEIKERFPYIFREGAQEGGGKPRLKLHAVEDEPFAIGKIVVTPLPVRHGVLNVLGWMFSSGEARAAYVTDVSYVPERTLRELRGCRLLVVGTLRMQPHATHFSFEEALQFALRAGASRIYFTHLSHAHSHAQISAWCRREERKNKLEVEIMPAYDGMEIEV